MAHLKKKISGCFEIRRDCDSGTACVNASLPEIVLQSVEKKELEKDEDDGRKQRKKEIFANQRKVFREKDGEKIKSLRVDEKK